MEAHVWNILALISSLQSFVLSSIFGLAVQLSSRNFASQFLRSWTWWTWAD